MTQRSMHWDGTILGDADALTVSAVDCIGWRMSNVLYESPFVDRMSRALWNGTGNRGVLYGWANALAVTGAATPISVDTGAAIIYGLYYENTAAVNKAIATPTNDTRYDRVVVRRDWTAQTARIYVITGVEGSGIPAMTQSPAPVGSGVYDIPLATLAVDTAGNITITDDREYCAFPTSFDTDAFATANIVDGSIDWRHRPTRTRRLFLGGGDLQPNVNAGYFTWAGVNYLTQVGPPPWGTGAADEEAWRTTGAASTYRGVYATFKLPADYVAGTDANVYVWWVNNAVVAANFAIVTAYQVWRGTIADWGGNCYGYTTTSATGAGAVSTVYRSLGQNIVYYTTDGFIHYYASFYNTAGAEDISIMGLEIQYTGYT